MIWRLAAAVAGAAVLAASPVVAQDLAAAEAATSEGIAAFSESRFPEAEMAFRRALDEWRAVTGPGSRETRIALENLALVVERRQKWGEAAGIRGEIAALVAAAEPGSDAEGEALYAWAFALSRTPGDDAFDVWDRAIAVFEARGNWARASGAASAAATDHGNASDHEAAMRLARRGIDFAERDGGARIQGEAWYALGVALSETSDHADAEAALERSIALHGGPDAVESAPVLDRLGVVLQEAGRHDEAGEVFTRAIELNERIHGQDSYVLAIGLNNLAILRDVQGRLAEAETLYRRALKLAEMNNRPGAAAAFRSNLGWVLHQQGRDLEAEPLLRQAAVDVEAALGPAHEDTASAWVNLGGSLAGQGRHAEAVELFRDALARYQAAVEPDHLPRAWTLNALGLSLAALEGPNAGAELLSQAEAITARRLTPAHPDRVRHANDLAENLIDRDETERALALARVTADAVRVRLDTARAKGDSAPVLNRARRAFAVLVRADWERAQD